MKLRNACLAALAALLLVATTARDAEARRRGGFGGSPGGSTLGIGLILLSPTGLSLELRLGPRSAIDAAIDFDVFDDDDSSISHIDYLAYLADLSRGGSISVPLYLGVGVVFLDHDYGRDDDDLHLGFRVPFGIALALRTAPVQFFFEGAVRVLFHDHDEFDDDDDADVDLTGGLGFRVYF
jgi:hypothetical protein